MSNIEYAYITAEKEDVSSLSLIVHSVICLPAGTEAARLVVQGAAEASSPPTDFHSLLPVSQVHR